MGNKNSGTRCPQRVGKSGGFAVFVSASPSGKSVHLLPLFLAIILGSCAAPQDTAHRVIVSAREQRLALIENGHLVATYPVSTSKFGLGDWRGSYRTPLGKMMVAEKIGNDAPLGSVFKDRRRTGEVVGVNARGRDPIVTRIIWLKGMEAQNANAFSRDIYIHGTPEERNIGKPASYGCIRMRSVDVVQLFNSIGYGAEVSIVDEPLATLVPELHPKQQLVAR